jgi:hypothetical protein
MDSRLNDQLKWSRAVGFSQKTKDDSQPWSTSNRHGSGMTWTNVFWMTLLQPHLLSSCESLLLSLLYVVRPTGTKRIALTM